VSTLGWVPHICVEYYISVDTPHAVLEITMCSEAKTCFPNNYSIWLQHSNVYSIKQKRVKMHKTNCTNELRLGVIATNYCVVSTID